jgi:hypothetical protein
MSAVTPPAQGKRAWFLLDFMTKELCFVLFLLLKLWKTLPSPSAPETSFSVLRILVVM